MCKFKVYSVVIWYISCKMITTIRLAHTLLLLLFNHSPPASSVTGFPRQEYWSGFPFSSPKRQNDLCSFPHCKWILYCSATRETQHIHFLTELTFCVCIIRAHMIYSLSNFPASNTILITIVAMLCIWSPVFTYLTIGCFTLINISLPPTTCSLWQQVLHSVSMNLTFHFRS